MLKFVSATSICLPTTLVAVTIALVTIAIALFIARHRRCHCHHPLCRCRCRRRSPATLIAVTIALFIAVAVHSPAILVTTTIALSPLPSLLPTTLIAVAITLTAIALSLFANCQPHRCCRRYCRRHRPPPTMPLPSLLPQSPLASSLPATLIAVAIALFVAAAIACPPPLSPLPSPSSLLPPPFMAIAIALLLPSCHPLHHHHLGPSGSCRCCPCLPLGHLHLPIATIAAHHCHRHPSQLRCHPPVHCPFAAVAHCHCAAIVPDAPQHASWLSRWTGCPCVTSMPMGLWCPNSSRPWISALRPCLLPLPSSLAPSSLEWRQRWHQR
jgi:hypothetical protein